MTFDRRSFKLARRTHCHRKPLAFADVLRCQIVVEHADDLRPVRHDKATDRAAADIRVFTHSYRRCSTEQHQRYGLVSSNRYRLIDPIAVKREAHQQLPAIVGRIKRDREIVGPFACPADSQRIAGQIGPNADLPSIRSRLNLFAAIRDKVNLRRSGRRNRYR